MDPSDELNRQDLLLLIRHLTIVSKGMLSAHQAGGKIKSNYNLISHSIEYFGDIEGHIISTLLVSCMYRENVGFISIFIVDTAWLINKSRLC